MTFGALLSALVLGAGDSGLIFHFDFKDAAGKKVYADKTGNFKAHVKDGAFAVQSGALRTSVGAQITVPDTRKPQSVKALTVMSWILKKSTPDHTPILSKGEHPYSMQFIFSLCWRYPGFFYKNLPRQNFYKGIYYLGSFGTGTHYPDNSWIKPGAHLVERSGRWRHVAAVFDQGIVRIYLDGKLSVERTAEKGNLLAANDRPFYIAAQRVTGENANLVTADMLLNDLRLYGKALSEAEIKKIIASIAEVSGGEAKFVESKHYPIVINNEVMADRIRAAAEKIVGAENILPRAQGMGGEDFAYFAQKKPGCMFELGVRNDELGYTVGVHNGKFMLDENALEYGVNIFVQFVLDNMNGIEFD